MCISTNPETCDFSRGRFIDVSEKGTEAAAATSVEMKITSAPINDPFYMEVNRPFFFTITHDTTDTVLFMGMMNQP
ncbi:serpin family protein [Bacillus niameyensis]|uniref:serpin family protein n=1 Tax=Bacillus niameyensis TaxID=1522308 RepID=UPI000785C0ED|nr:serpin family protein [Bacillus niameyensis]